MALRALRCLPVPAQPPPVPPSTLSMSQDPISAHPGAVSPCTSDAVGALVSSSVPANPDLLTGLPRLTLDLTHCFTLSVQGTSYYPGPGPAQGRGAGPALGPP